MTCQCCGGEEWANGKCIKCFTKTYHNNKHSKELIKKLATAVLEENKEIIDAIDSAIDSGVDEDKVNTLRKSLEVTRKSTIISTALESNVFRESPQCQITGVRTKKLDVDHFFPKSIYPQLAFYAANLYFVDRGINRMKSNMEPDDFRDYFCSILREYNGNENSFIERFNLLKETVLAEIEKEFDRENTSLSNCYSCFWSKKADVCEVDGILVCVSCGEVKGPVLK